MRRGGTEMSEKIKRVIHRHGDQKQNEPDLILEVGSQLPWHYQEGRRRGLRVERIDDGDPLRCVLSDGDVILIGSRNVTEVIHE